jgi:hypothetical protein
MLIMSFQYERGSYILYVIMYLILVLFFLSLCAINNRPCNNVHPGMNSPGIKEGVHGKDKTRLFPSLASNCPTEIERI